MEAKVLFVCLFVSLTICDTNGQVGSLCRPNERLLQCGCPRTCLDPVPNCKGVCKEGCFCEDGQVRNAEGYCVKLADCPPMPSSYKQDKDTSEPRVNGGICPEDEEYKFCEPCNKTCEMPNPMCPAQCARGCFCKGSLLRDKDGRCVQWGQCSNIQALIKEKEDKFVEPIPARYSCGRSKLYKTCEKCIRSCSNPEPVCSTTCKAGCFCKDGLVENDGKCVRVEECPRS